MAASATEFIDQTTADAFIAELWSKEALIARESNLIFAPLVDRKFEKEMRHGDTLHVPAISNLAARTKTINTAIDYETVTESNTDIVVSTYQYAAIAIEDNTKKQATQDLMDRYAPKMSYALALAADDALAALVDDFSQTVGTLTQEVTNDNALRAIQYLDDSDTPQSDRAWVISPAQKAGFGKLDSFVHGDYSKQNSEYKTGLSDASLGKWQGTPVYFSTNVEGTNAAGHDSGLFHKSAIAMVMQLSPEFHEFWDIDYQALKMSTSQLYGVKEMRDEGGVWVKSA